MIGSVSRYLIAMSSMFHEPIGWKALDRRLVRNIHSRMYLLGIGTAKAAKRPGCMDPRTEGQAPVINHPDLSFYPDMSLSNSMSQFSIAQLALPGVAALIGVLAYGSQLLFLHIEPSPLTKGEARSFNLLICCIWLCYFRACFTNPGSVPAGLKGSDAHENASSSPEFSNDQRHRWCRKCNAAKPPRAHHCKSCGR